MLLFVLHASDLRQQAVTVIGGALGLGTNIFQHNLMWIRVEGTHEPIISRDVWDTVVSIGLKKVRKPTTANGFAVRQQRICPHRGSASAVQAPQHGQRQSGTPVQERPCDYAALDDVISEEGREVV